MSASKKTKAQKTAKLGSPNRSRNQARMSEAPDRGLDSLEAPEVRKVRHTEAPDWGEGRESMLGNEFTEGRSKS
jgi:hypothetical protein